MSVVIADENVGDPIALMVALGEVAEKVDTRPYGELLSVIEADGNADYEYLLRVRGQARRVLADVGPKLSRDTRTALIRLTR